MTRTTPAATLIAAGALLAATLGADSSSAQSPAGAASCSGCHAPATLPTAIPVLEGRVPADLAAAMREFRSGARRATVMDRIAKGFSDDEIAAIAAYVAGGGR